MKDKVRSLLIRIKALADGGATEGERHAARSKLDGLLTKHHLCENDLDSEERFRGEYTYGSAIEKRLLEQLLYMVAPGEDLYRRPGGRSLFADLTCAQALVLREMFDHYRVEIRKDMETFLVAFFQTHHIFPDVPPSNGEPGEDAREEWHRAAAMRMGMASKTFRPNNRRLEFAE